MDRHEPTPWPRWRTLLAVLALRYLCHAAALLLILPHEMQPGAALPDLLLRHVPYVDWLARWNYVFWVLCYIPPALWIAWKDRQLFLRLVVQDPAGVGRRPCGLELAERGYGGEGPRDALEGRG